ncbi:MAG: hypothetical protein JW776_04680 [Candidatus Lokiarchaeota archaeon]|nr:hypothetical protein [Candidatus Lokiarchaeota archaeon]
MKALVIFGSRYGCTLEIAQRIADIIDGEGIETHLVNLKDTKKKNWPMINAYDGVVIGSGIQISQWVKESKKYLKEIADELKKGKIKYALFVSSAYSSVDSGKAKELYIDKFIEKMGLPPPVISAAFAGVLDFSEDSNLGKIKKEALKAAAKGMTNEKKELEFDYQGCNDLRDWDSIEKFAHEFVDLLK